jgi:hypothetical protein
MLGTKEHYEVIAMFDREFKGHRLDKEAKDMWRKGHVYQDGQTDALFNAYLRGYALGKAMNRTEAA